MVVPLPGWLRIVKSPLSSVARACIFFNPLPERELEWLAISFWGLNPAPLSFTVSTS